MDYQNHDYNYRENSWGGYGNPDYEAGIIKDTRRCFSRIGLVYLVFLAVSVLSQLGVSGILAAAGLDERLGYNGSLLITMLSMYPLAVPLTGLLVRWVPARGNIGQERWGAGALCGIFVVSMGVLYTGNLVGTILMAIAGVIKGEPVINGMQELIMSMEPWTIILSAVIAAPVMEELVFRKFLLDRIAGFGHWTAMVVSGLVFGIAHGNFYQFFYAFGLGMIFAYVYLHTGKLLHHRAPHGDQLLGKRSASGASVGSGKECGHRRISVYCQPDDHVRVRDLRGDSSGSLLERSVLSPGRRRSVRGEEKGGCLA